MKFTDWMYKTFLLVLFCLSLVNAAAQTDSTQHNNILEEVVVTSSSASQRLSELQIGVEKVNVETVKNLPTLFGERDIVKSLQLLPGVKIEGDGLGGYQVRGGTSAQNNIMLDGATVYNVGHMMGLFSAFNDDAIGSAELFKGLMPPRLGGGASSVLNMSTRAGDGDRQHFSTSIGLLSAKAELDGPMGKNASYLVAARTSYLNLFIKSLKEYKNNSLSFYDLNTKFNVCLGDKDQLYFSIFRGCDMIDVEKMLNMSWSNTSVSLGWLHTTSTKRYAHTQLVASNYATDQGVDIYSFNVNMQGYNRQLTLRHQQTWSPSRHHSFNAGGETTLLGLQSAEWHMTSVHEREKRDNWFVALWAADDVTFFNKQLQLSAGVRMEWFSALGGKPYYNIDDNGNIIETLHPKKGDIVKTYAVVQPRLSLSWKMGERWAFKAGYSRLAQPIQPVRNSSMTMPIDRFTTISNNIKPQIADQLATGVSMMTNQGAWDFSTDFYWKKLKNVYDYRDGKTFNSEIEIERLIVGGNGRAYGMEFAAHKNHGTLTGWMAYTLSWVQNKIDGIMEGQWYTAPNDRRHDLVVVLMAQLSQHWTISSTWRYTTGQAMTAPAGKYVMNGETHYYFGERNVSRAPDYHRLDLSLAYNKKKGKALHTWTFGLYNAYNRYNPFFVSFEEDDTKPSGTKTVVTTLFGIVPTVSFSLKY